MTSCAIIIPHQPTCVRSMHPVPIQPSYVFFASSWLTDIDPERLIGMICSKFHKTSGVSILKTRLQTYQVTGTYTTTCPFFKDNDVIRFRVNIYQRLEELSEKTYIVELQRLRGCTVSFRKLFDVMNVQHNSFKLCNEQEGISRL